MLDNGRGLGGGREKTELWSRAVECISPAAASPSSQLPHCELSGQLTTDPPGRNKCSIGSENVAAFPGGAGHQSAESGDISTTRLMTSRGRHHPTGRHPGLPIPPWRSCGTAGESGSPLPQLPAAELAVFCQESWVPKPILGQSFPLWLLSQAGGLGPHTSFLDEASSSSEILRFEEIMPRT